MEKGHRPRPAVEICSTTAGIYHSYSGMDLSVLLEERRMDQVVWVRHIGERFVPRCHVHKRVEANGHKTGTW